VAVRVCSGLALLVGIRLSSASRSTGSSSATSSGFRGMSSFDALAPSSEHSNPAAQSRAHRRARSTRWRTWRSPASSADTPWSSPRIPSSTRFPATRCSRMRGASTR
jgi:hypothetical protein